MSLAAARSCELAPHKIYDMGFPIMRESSAPTTCTFTYTPTLVQKADLGTDRHRRWRSGGQLYTHIIYTHARTQHFTWCFGVYVCARKYIGAVFAYMQSSSRERTIRACISYVWSPEDVHPSRFLSTVRHRVYHNIFYTHHAV